MWKESDVSEVTSIFSWAQLIACSCWVSCLVYFSAVKMGEINSFKTLGCLQITLYYDPEDFALYRHRWEPHIQHRLSVSNRVLKKILVPTGGQLTGGWKKKVRNGSICHLNIKTIIHCKLQEWTADTHKNFYNHEIWWAPLKKKSVVYRYGQKFLSGSQTFQIIKQRFFHKRKYRYHTFSHNTHLYIICIYNNHDDTNNYTPILHAHMIHTAYRCVWGIWNYGNNINHRKHTNSNL